MEALVSNICLSI